MMSIELFWARFLFDRLSEAGLPVFSLKEALLVFSRSLKVLDAYFLTSSSGSLGFESLDWPLLASLLLKTLISVLSALESLLLELFL